MKCIHCGKDMVLVDFGVGHRNKIHETHWDCEQCNVHAVRKRDADKKFIKITIFLDK